MANARRAPFHSEYYLRVSTIWPCARLHRLCAIVAKTRRRHVTGRRVHRDNNNNIDSVVLPLTYRKVCHNHRSGHGHSFASLIIHSRIHSRSSFSASDYSISEHKTHRRSMHHSSAGCYRPKCQQTDCQILVYNLWHRQSFIDFMRKAETRETKRTKKKIIKNEKKKKTRTKTFIQLGLLWKRRFVYFESLFKRLSGRRRRLDWIFKYAVYGSDVQVIRLCEERALLTIRSGALTSS